MLKSIVEDCSVITTIREALLEVHGPAAPVNSYSDKELVSYVVAQTAGLLVSAGEEETMCFFEKDVNL